MRRLELTTDLQADAAQAWTVLTDTESWPSWGTLVVAARGDFVPGHVWTMELRGGGFGPRQMHPRLISIAAPRRIVFETRIVSAALVKMVHVFDIEPVGADRSMLRQSFEATGLLIAPLWRPLRGGMVQFGQLGDDLARHLASRDPHHG